MTAGPALSEEEVWAEVITARPDDVDKVTRELPEVIEYATRESAEKSFVVPSAYRTVMTSWVVVGREIGARVAPSPVNAMREADADAVTDTASTSETFMTPDPSMRVLPQDDDRRAFRASPHPLTPAELTLTDQPSETLPETTALDPVAQTVVPEERLTSTFLLSSKTA